MAVSFDFIDSSILKNDNGFRVDRVAVITGTTGTPSAKLYNAINDASMPDIGDAHPDIAAITLREINLIEVIDDETIKVSLSYYDEPGSETGSSNATVRATASTSTEETGVDSAGNAMETQYQRVNTTGGTTAVYPNFSATFEKIKTTYDFTYTGATFPKTEIDTYSGKLNSAIWNGYAIGTVFCAGVYADQQGENYQIRFSFVINPDGWVFVAKVPDPPTLIFSSTDVDLDVTTGQKEFDIYDSVDFTPLGFTV